MGNHDSEARIVGPDEGEGVTNDVHPNERGITLPSAAGSLASLLIRTSFVHSVLVRVRSDRQARFGNMSSTEIIPVRVEHCVHGPTDSSALGAGRGGDCTSGRAC